MPLVHTLLTVSQVIPFTLQVETRSITSHITCNTKNVIYMVLQCNRCNLQYIGETKRRLKDRFNEHRRAVDKTNIKSKPTTVSEHFLSHSNHSHTDMQLIPLEKIHSSRDSVRKARESHKPEEGWYGQPKYCYEKTIHVVLNQLWSTLWTSRSQKYVDRNTSRRRIKMGSSIIKLKPGNW